MSRAVGVLVLFLLAQELAKWVAGAWGVRIVSALFLVLLFVAERDASRLVATASDPERAGADSPPEGAP